MKTMKQFAGRTAAAVGVASLALSTVTLGVAGASLHKAHATGKTILACEVTDTGGRDDKSFNQSAYQGLLDAVKAAKSLKVTVNTKVASSKSSSDYVPNINSFVSQKCNIIVTVGFLMANDTWTSANNNPKQHFAIVDNTNGDPNRYTSGCATASNLLGLTYQTDQAGFLGGYVAAALSKTHVIATYGGMQFPSVTLYMDGFVAGARYYNAHLPKGAKAVKVRGWDPNAQKGSFVGSFTDTTRCGHVDQHLPERRCGPHLPGCRWRWSRNRLGREDVEQHAQHQGVGRLGRH
jgi:basic membrane protein A